MRIQKSKGSTPTERALSEFCERSFLKLWSYPNPFKDDRKELCDLIAVFGNDILIFFDRSVPLRFREGDDPLILWQRWRRKVIDAQVKTAHGAERYILAGRTIFLDNRSETPLPIKFDLSKLRIFKFVIAHGAAQACLEFSEDNVFGSLGVIYSNSCGKTDHPFIVDINKNRPIHILDSTNLHIILSEIDTFFDFVEYIKAKEDAISKYQFISYCGEEDLLAHYFFNFDSEGNRHFIGLRDSDYDGISIGEGEWLDFSQTRAYENRKNANKISYMWDELIQITCQNAIDGKLLGHVDKWRNQSRAATISMNAR